MICSTKWQGIDRFVYQDPDTDPSTLLHKDQVNFNEFRQFLEFLETRFNAAILL